MLDLFISVHVLRIVDKHGNFVFPKCCRKIKDEATPCVWYEHTKFVIHATPAIDDSRYILILKELFCCLTHSGSHKKAGTFSHKYVSIFINKHKISRKICYDNNKG